MRREKEVKIYVENEEYVVGTLLDKSSDRSEWKCDDLKVPEADFFGQEIIIIMHGLHGNRNSIFFPELADKLPYASFRFDFRGNGKSSGDPKLFEDYNRSELQDFFCVVKAFTSNNWSICGIVGHSKAGTLVAQSLGLHPNLSRFAVNISGRLIVHSGLVKKLSNKMREILEKGYSISEYKTPEKTYTFKTTLEHMESLKLCDEHISRIKDNTSCKVAVLTVHGKKDTIVPFDNALYMASIIRNHELFEVEDGDHMFNGKHDVVVSKIVSWIWDQTMKLVPFLNIYKDVCLSYISTETGLSYDIGGYLTNDSFVIKKNVIHLYHFQDYNKDSVKMDYNQHGFRVLDWRPHSRDTLVASLTADLIENILVQDGPLKVYSGPELDIDYRDMALAMCMALLRVPLDIVSRILAFMCSLKKINKKLETIPNIDSTEVASSYINETFFICVNLFISRFLYEILAQYNSFSNFLLKNSNISLDTIEKFKCKVRQ